MKNTATLILFLLIFSLSSANLFVQDPLQWSSQPGNIDSAIITVTPNSMFAHVDLELVYSASETSFASISPDAVLEVVTRFELPNDAIVIDSWLWIEEYISIAHLIDLNLATNIYESFVERAQDPSLLRFSSYGDYLDLNIYPMDGDSSRKVKLSFLVPMKDVGSNLSINPIVDIFTDDNPFAASYCKLILHSNDQNFQGYFDMASGNFSTIEATSAYSAYELNINAITSSFRITYPKPPVEISLIYKDDGDGGFFHIDHYFDLPPTACVLANFDLIFDGMSFQYDSYSEMLPTLNGFRLVESGQYYSNPPEALVAHFLCNGIYIRDTIVLHQEYRSFTNQVWANDFCISNTVTTSSGYINFYNTDQEVQDVSMEHRVLSRYTAFLALPKEDSALASAGGNSGGGFVATNTVNLHAGKVHFRIYPNPMIHSSHFEYANKTGQVIKDIKVRIIDVNGRVIHKYNPFTVQSGENFIFTWDGQSDLGQISDSGVYFVIVEYGETKEQFRLVKL